MEKSDQFECLTCICFLVESCLLLPETFPLPLHLIYLMIFKIWSENHIGSFSQCIVLFSHVYIKLIVYTQPEIHSSCNSFKSLCTYRHRYQKICYTQLKIHSNVVSICLMLSHVSLQLLAGNTTFYTFPLFFSRPTPKGGREIHIG